MVLCIALLNNEFYQFRVDSFYGLKVMARKKKLNKMSVCKTVMPPYCHTDTGSDTVHKMISKELIGKYQRHLRKEQKESYQ